LRECSGRDVYLAGAYAVGGDMNMVGEGGRVMYSCRDDVRGDRGSNLPVLGIWECA